MSNSVRSLAPLLLKVRCAIAIFAPAIAEQRIDMRQMMIHVCVQVPLIVASSPSVQVYLHAA